MAISQYVPLGSALTSLSNFLATDFTISSSSTYVIPIGNDAVANNLTINGTLYIYGYQYVGATMTIGSGGQLQVDGGGTAVIVFS